MEKFNKYQNYILTILILLFVNSIIISIYMQSIYNKNYFSGFVELLDYSFLRNTDTTEYLSYAISVITAIIVAIPAFLLPLFFNVFEDKIKNNTANPDFIFDEIMKKYHIKFYYISIFLFIIYLFLQNYIEILYSHSLTLFTNITLTIFIIYIII